jgi:hypothetical protein
MIIEGFTAPFSQIDLNCKVAGNRLHVLATNLRVEKRKNSLKMEKARICMAFFASYARNISTSSFNYRHFSQFPAALRD